MSNAGRAARRRPGRRQRAVWILARGLLLSIVCTLAGVVVFALLMQLIRPSDGVIRVFNQALKLLSIGLGVGYVVRHLGGGALQGALLGLLYMLLGVGVYALLSGQGLTLSPMLADLGMGVAAGGLIGLLLGRSA